MKLPETQTITKVIYLIGGLIVLFLIYKIMTGLGILKTAKNKAEDIKKENALSDFRTMEEFNPSFKDKGVFTPIGLNAAALYAEDLRKSMRGLGTNEERLYTTFGKLKCQANISEVASQYYLKFKRDLRTDILNDLTDKEIVILSGIINNLPKI
jgi:hypothetical protein